MFSYVRQKEKAWGKEGKERSKVGKNSETFCQLRLARVRMSHSVAWGNRECGRNFCRSCQSPIFLLVKLFALELYLPLLEQATNIQFASISAPFPRKAFNEKILLDSLAVHYACMRISGNKRPTWGKDGEARRRIDIRVFFM
jgi:hypothetical protein